TSFLFSSRRRHTRSKRDWSSDVCSSDLARRFRGEEMTGFRLPGPARLQQGGGAGAGIAVPVGHGAHLELAQRAVVAMLRHEPSEIGRASCRERGEIAAMAGTVKAKHGDP